MRPHATHWGGKSKNMKENMAIKTKEEYEILLIFQYSFPSPEEEYDKRCFDISSDILFLVHYEYNENKNKIKRKKNSRMKYK